MCRCKRCRKRTKAVVRRKHAKIGVAFVCQKSQGREDQLKPEQEPADGKTRATHWIRLLFLWLARRDVTCALKKPVAKTCGTYALRLTDHLLLDMAALRSPHRMLRLKSFPMFVGRPGFLLNGV